MKVARTTLSRVVADKTLKDGHVSKSYARQVAAYIISERRGKEVESILRDVQADWAKLRYVEVLAYSAHPLSQQNMREITDFIKQFYSEAKVVKVTSITDKTLLAGIKLEIANKQMDISARHRLNKFKRLTTENY